MRIRVLWFGRPARSPFEAAVADYRNRVDHRWPAEDVALKPDTRGRASDPAACLAREAAVLRQRVPERFRLVALDEGGRSMSSTRFAEMLGRAHESGCAGMAFAIGSDHGLDQALCQAADQVLSLSSLTLPHLVARLVLWEQLYRATDILGAARYHRSGIE